MADRHKRCPRCGEYKDRRTEYNTRSNGHTDCYCITCRREYQNERNAARECTGKPPSLHKPVFVVRTCPVCFKDFECIPSSHQLYCRTACKSRAERERKNCQPGGYAISAPG